MRLFAIIEIGDSHLTRRNIIYTVTISNKPYQYSIWAGEKLNEGLIAVDTETTVRERPEIPQLVLTTASDGTKHVIISNDNLEKFLQMHKNARFVFYNVSFDFWVINQFLAGKENILWDAAENNKLHDYMLLDMLYRLAVNDTFPVMRNLGETTKYYAKMEIDKEDPYRMRYEEILNHPLDTVDRGFLDYAIKDTIVTWIGFRQLFMFAKKLAYSYGVSSDLLNKFGLFTESIQVKAAICLTKITNNGIKLNTALSNEMHREIESQVWEIVQKLDSEYSEQEYNDIPGLFKKDKHGDFMLTDNNIPRINRKRLSLIFEDVAKDLNTIPNVKVVVPLTEKKKISTSMPLWGDYIALNDFLTKWKIWSDNTKAVQFFSKLDKKYVYPRYKYFVRTGRTSQQDPNCVDGETEILTNRGWIKFAEAYTRQKELKVLQLHPDTRHITETEAEWIKTSTRIWVNIESHQMSAKVTPDHRLLGQKNKEELFFIEAMNCPTSLPCVKTGFYNVQDKSYRKDTMRVVAVLCAGSVKIKEGEYVWTAPIKQTAKVRSLKYRLGKYYSEVERSEDKKSIILKLYERKIKRPLEITDNKAELGDWIFKLDYVSLTYLHEELVNLNVKGYWMDILNILVAENKEYNTCKVTKKVNIVDTPEDAYCVSVPSEIFFARRNGKIYATGNCQQIKKGKMREIIIPKKGYAMVAADYSFIELRTLAFIMEKLFKKSVMADVIRAGRDPHAFLGGMLVNMDYEEFCSLKKLKPDFYDKWRQNAKACFHKDVECLTPKGWKKISEVTKENLIAQYTKSGKIEFVHPTDIIVQENKNLYELQSRHFSLRVTEDHNMYCLDWAEKPCTCKPKDFKRKARKTVHAGYLEGAISDEIGIRQAVAIQADGSICNLRYSFGFRKQRKINRFRELFKGIILYDKIDRETRFNISREGDYSPYLNEDKTFNTEQILKLDLKSRQAFIDELFYWDGTHKTDRAFSFTSVNLNVIHTIQAVAATCGYRTVFNEWIPNLSPNPAYSLGIAKCDTARPSKMSYNLVEEKTTVYCVSVPSTLLVVKDKESIEICHNCGFGIPGGLSAPSLLNYAKNIYHIKDWTIETAKTFRDKVCNEIYPELGKYLQEDTMRIMCESLGCSTEDAWELFEMHGERSPFILNCVKNVVKGEPFKKDGTKYQDGFINRIWDNLLKLNANPSLHIFLKDRACSLDLMKKIFWTSSSTLTGRVRGKVSFTQNKNCLDAETEALTKRGWVKGFDLTLEDEILTKNIDTGYLEWQKPTDLKFYPDYEGPLVEFKTKNFSAISTPDHRWLIYNKCTGKNECKTTDKISVYGDSRIHRTGEYIAPEKQTYSNDFVEICGWYLTDGSGKSTKRKTVEDYIQVQLFQSERANMWKVEKIRKALDNLNYTNSTMLEERTQLRRFHLTREASEILYNLFPKRLLNIGFLLNLTKHQLDLLLNTMIDGDGCRSGKISFSCSRKESADIFQVLCTMNNLSSATVKRDMSKYKPMSSKLLNIPKQGIIYIVNVLKRDKVQIQKNHKKEFYSKQPIWCPMLPNTYFVARRDNKVFITGNTPFQGLASDGAKLAGYRLIKEEAKLGYKLVNFVHDEFLFEVPDLGRYVDKKLVDYILQVMCEEMGTLTPGIPIAGEYTVARSWTKKNPDMRVDGDKIYF